MSSRYNPQLGHCDVKTGQEMLKDDDDCSDRSTWFDFRVVWCAYRLSVYVIGFTKRAAEPEAPRWDKRAYRD